MLTFFLAVFAISFNLPAQAPLPPREKRFEIRGDFSYFSTESNYGSGAEIPDGGSFTSALTNAQVRYDLDSNLRGFAGATYGWSESDDGYDSRIHSGLSEVFVGGQYWFRLPRVYVVPQGDFVYPAFRVDEFSYDPLIGDGAMRVRGGSWAILHFGILRPFAYVGYEYRDEGRSHLLPYNVGLMVKPKLFWLQAEFRGYHTIVDDEDVDFQEDRDLYLRQVDANSYRFYSINPSLGEASIEGGVELGPVGLKAGFAKTILGDNSADGWTALVGISFSPTPPPIERHREEENFEFKTEDYDKSLFKEQEELTPTDGYKRRIRKKVRKKPEVDKLIQDTQRRLEDN